MAQHSRHVPEQSARTAATAATGTPRVASRAVGRAAVVLARRWDRLADGDEEQPLECVRDDGELGVGRGRRRGGLSGSERRGDVARSEVVDERIEAGNELVDEWQDDAVKGVAELGDGHEQEVDPVVDDGVARLLNGVRDCADKEVVVRQVRRLRVVVGLGVRRRRRRGRLLVVASSGRCRRRSVDDRVQHMQELVLQIELAAVDREKESDCERRLDRRQARELRLAARDEDLQELGHDGVEVRVERAERRGESLLRVGPEEAASMGGSARVGEPA